MKFSIEYGKQPKKFLKKLDKHIIKRIMDKADEVFEDNLVPHNAKTIVGKRSDFIKSLKAIWESECGSEL